MSKKIKCGYYVNCKLSNPSLDARNLDFGSALWKKSAHLINTRSSFQPKLLHNLNSDCIGNIDCAISSFTDCTCSNCGRFISSAQTLNSSSFSACESCTVVSKWVAMWN